MTFLVPAPEHAPRCAQCGKTLTGGWPLRTVVTAAGTQLVCRVGPCGQLAGIRHQRRTIGPEDVIPMPFQPTPMEATIPANSRGA